MRRRGGPNLVSMIAVALPRRTLNPDSIKIPAAGKTPGTEWV